MCDFACVPAICRAFVYNNLGKLIQCLTKNTDYNEKIGIKRMGVHIRLQAIYVS